MSLYVTLADIIDLNGNFVIFNTNLYQIAHRWIALKKPINFYIEHFLLGRTVSEIIAKNEKSAEL